MKYEVTFKIAASQGGQTRKVAVDVVGSPKEHEKADAIIQASLTLDAEGLDRWDLVSCVPVTS